MCALNEKQNKSQNYHLFEVTSQYVMEGLELFWIEIPVRLFPEETRQ